MKIILLTSNFPYGEGESFILSELPFLAENQNSEIIAVNAHRDSSQKRDVVDSIRCSRLFAGPFSIMAKMAYSIRCLLSKAFYEEVNNLRRQKRLNYKILLELLAFQARGERISSALKTRFSNELLTNPSASVFYSYWLVDCAYAIAKLKLKYGCKAIARTHRGDLYEEWHKNGYAPMRKYMFNHLDAVYPVSQMGTDYMVHKYGYKEKIVTSYLGSVNYNGARRVSEGSIFRIVTCAYISEVKRIPLLVEALSQIIMREIEWVHFGDGPERDVVLEAVKNLPDNIRYELRGNAPHGDILAYYRDNDVHLFVNTSTSEGLPVSIMEAVSFGIPVVATDVGGTREIVQNGVNGYLVGADVSPENLAKVILRVINTPDDVYKELRKSAYSYWNEHFNADKNYRVFYEGLLEGREAYDD